MRWNFAFELVMNVLVVETNELGKFTVRAQEW
jgi:hypothetical protein